MAARAKNVPLPGSHRTAPARSRVIGPVHPDQRVEVTIRLRPRAVIPAKVRSDATTGRSHKERRYLTRNQLSAKHGALCRRG